MRQGETRRNLCVPPFHIATVVQNNPALICCESQRTFKKYYVDQQILPCFLYHDYVPGTAFIG